VKTPAAHAGSPFASSMMPIVPRIQTHATGVSEEHASRVHAPAALGARARAERIPSLFAPCGAGSDSAATAALAGM
jgi:hypothetical protein